MPQYTAPRAQNRGLLKPRNPLVAPSLMRKSGRHQGGNQRHAQRRELEQQLQSLDRLERSP
ncbi:hypothetical protein RQP53_23940 [Paucibacter sp. APW11]|uniref:Uncharacterized protein n=1 Tax=Roseateles aquae TaxID=3077235 RepID=A0ABU3PIS2_9BURK|nr:hypothetical protein [Paucibacter sp. APW11]MDT9002354.1 hypothetical protein [Paucibacter sp. APW11]